MTKDPAHLSPQTRFVTVAEDVTELEPIEVELRKYREHLEQMVQARTADLAAANASLLNANEELTAFAYSVSHDLRAPLRTVDGFSKILLEDYGAKLDAEGLHLITVMRDSVMKMSRMIDDILAFSRTGRAEMNQAPCNMSELVRSAIDDLQALAAERKLEFVIGKLPSALADGPMMQRVWTNLIDNAIKYTGRKPEARIEIGARPAPGETVYYVRDNGVGFDMRYVDRLFRVFQRLHGEEFAGTGVGLAIVKRIVSRHGGRVWAEGAAGKGATFHFSLPHEESNHGRPPHRN